jgi:hypothetical protein
MRSTCIFGSTARKRADRYSDRDVLVVASDKHELAVAAFQWQSAGWSVSSFTHEEISGMASRGSLFVQHLKQEGVIVQDEAEFLGSLLQTYQPKRDYEPDLADSTALLFDISAIHTRAYWPTMCCADIAYGAIRNIAISRLASRGVYIFDYNKLLDYWAAECLISLSECAALRGLRILKHMYRARRADADIEPAYTTAVEAAMKLFGSVRGFPAPDEGYRGLRLLELDLVTRFDPRHLDTLPTTHTLAGAWAFIRSPRGYPQPRPRSSQWLGTVRNRADHCFPV